MRLTLSRPLSRMKARLCSRPVNRALYTSTSRTFSACSSCAAPGSPLSLESYRQLSDANLAHDERIVTPRITAGS